MRRVLSESNHQFSLSPVGRGASVSGVCVRQSQPFSTFHNERVLSLHCDLGHHRFSACFVAFERCPISWVGTITPCLLPWKAERARTSSMRVPKVNLHLQGAELRGLGGNLRSSSSAVKDAGGSCSTHPQINPLLSFCTFRFTEVTYWWVISTLRACQSSGIV